MTQTITISPITRLEGHGKIDIILDQDGNVKDAFLQVVELRGFERFCQGRPAEEMPRITPRICGVCPGAHHMASAKAVDALFDADPPVAAKKVRELFYNAHMAHSHILHLFALAAPDFIVGSDAPAAQRNIVGVIDKVGLELGKEVIKHRGYCQRIQEIIGGKATHPVFGIPGGISKPLSEEMRDEIRGMAQACLEFAKITYALFRGLFTENQGINALLLDDAYHHETYYMGMVDAQGKVNFYDGTLRVIAPDGKLIDNFSPTDYLDHIAERVEPWSYLKFPYLKAVGWKGFTDGVASGVYRVNSLARLNVSDGMATPLAQEAYARMYEYFGGKPIHHTMAFHWARVVETLYACERMLELIEDPAIVSKAVRTPVGTPTEGVGCVEAPRGTLIHHYTTDEDGILKRINLIVATVQNNAAINMSVKRAAQHFIRNGQVDHGKLNLVEMAFRAYDPCFACGTHDLPGTLGLELRIFNKNGSLLDTLNV